jgi:RNA polymerase sigma-54 factor
MALGPRLDLRQSQSLVMTPQLQQAIRLLALSNLEVEAFIAEEIEKNPLLETGASDPEAPAAPEPETASDVEFEGDEFDYEGEPLPEIDAGGGEGALDIDANSEDFHQDSAVDSGMGPDARGLDGGLGLEGIGTGGGAEDGPDFDAFESAGISLQEHLMRQAGELLSGTDFVIATHIVEQIDETGYFLSPLLDVAQRLGVPLAQVERVLAVIQTLDPAGVAARNLAECLALQAKDADRYDPCMARLIANLDYLAKGNLPALKRICQVDDEDLADMIRELRAYDPKPGLRFSADAGRVDAITPDIFVARRGAVWAVELNSATLPKLLLNRSYYQELSSGPQDRQSRAWLNECLQSANWLMKALDQRARTIVKVASEIVTRQEGFFRHGVAHLKPLTLRAVAETIGMHESTVSRVTSNKYLACERGLFELKYFFTSGIQSADGGDAVSAEAVKSRIKALIAAEEANAILSDDTLVDMLKGEGFDIARRTVAKYREAIGLGSSVQRRRQKAIGRAA